MIWLIFVVMCILALYVFAVACRRSASTWLTKWQYAHRGLHGPGRPENTLPAFAAACAESYGIELDVHLSRDGQVIVFHDDDLRRLAGRPERPEDLTAAELGALSILGTSHGAPTLREVLDLVDGRVPVLIEIKSTGFAGRLEEETWKLVKDYPGLFAFQSFSPFSVGWFRKNVPQAARGQLSCFFKDGNSSVPRIALKMVRHLMTNFVCRPNFISYGKEGVSTFIVRLLRRFGIPVLAWTIEDPHEEALVEPYCDSIIFQSFVPAGAGAKRPGSAGED